MISIKNKRHILYGLNDQTYKFGDDRITNQNFIKFGEKKVLRKRLKINKFYGKLKLKYFFVMGHAIINRLIGLVNKNPKDDNFFKKTFIFTI